MQMVLSMDQSIYQKAEKYFFSLKGWSSTATQYRQHIGQEKPKCLNPGNLPRLSCKPVVSNLSGLVVAVAAMVMKRKRGWFCALSQMQLHTHIHTHTFMHTLAHHFCSWFCMGYSPATGLQTRGWRCHKP